MAIRTLTLTTILAGSLPVAPSSAHRGQHTPDDPTYVGPTGGEAVFLSPRGNVLHPTGTGVYRYVDASVAFSGDGLSPATAYRTLQEAIDVHQPGDSILVEPGVYGAAVEGPGAFDTPNRATATDRVKLSRRGAGRVEITATDPVGAWVPCVAGDADGNPNWASMWKATIPAGRALEPWESVLMQDGRMAYLRVDGRGYSGTDEMFSQNNSVKGYTTADDGLLYSGANGSTVTMSMPSILGAIPQGALDDARAVVHFTSGNNSLPGNFVSHDASAGTAVVDFQRSQQDPGTYTILLNIARNVDEAGQWAYKAAPGGGFTLFFYPWDDTAMDRVRLSERDNVFNLRQMANWTLYGLDGTGAGGGTGTRESLIWWSNENTAVDRPGLIFEECRAYAFFGSGEAGKGFEFARCPGMRILNCTVADGTNAKGISLVGSPGAWVDHCLMERLGNTALNASTALEQVFSYNEIRELGTAHGNGMSMYQGTRRVVVWGNKFDVGQVIAMTHQESADIWIGMNVVVAPQGEPFGHRGIENNGTNPPRRSGTVFSGEITLLNNTVAPWPGADGSEAAAGIITGKTTNALHHAVNNVSFGGVDPTDDGARVQPTSVERDGVTYRTRIGRMTDNVVIRNFSTLIPSNPFFATGGNLHVLRAREVFADLDAGIYAPAPGGPLDGRGVDHSDLLPTGPWINWFDMNRDFNGVPFKWTNQAPRGALLTRSPG